MPFQASCISPMSCNLDSIWQLSGRLHISAPHHSVWIVSYLNAGCNRARTWRRCSSQILGRCPVTWRVRYSPRLKPINLGRDVSLQSLGREILVRFSNIDLTIEVPALAWVGVWV